MDVEVSKMILKVSYEVEAGYLWRKKCCIYSAFTECFFYLDFTLGQMAQCIFSDVPNEIVLNLHHLF